MLVRMSLGEEIEARYAVSLYMSNHRFYTSVDRETAAVRAPGLPKFQPWDDRGFERRGTFMTAQIKIARRPLAHNTSRFGGLSRCLENDAATYGTIVVNVGPFTSGIMFGSRGR